MIKLFTLLLVLPQQSMRIFSRKRSLEIKSHIILNFVLLFQSVSCDHHRRPQGYLNQHNQGLLPAHHRKNRLTTTEGPVAVDPPDMCPCSSSLPVAQCAYDQSAVASTLEEALLNFQNPLLQGEIRVQERVKDSKKGLNITESPCTSSKCRKCSKEILEKIRSQLSLRRTSNGVKSNRTMAEAENLIKKWNLERVRSGCPDLPSPSLAREREDHKELHPEELQQISMAVEGKPFEKPEIDVSTSENKKKVSKPSSVFKELPPVIKIDETATKPTPIANDTQPEYDIPEAESIIQLACMERGRPVSSNSIYCGLCSVCWEWIILRPEFSPQYVNRMSCEQSDKLCLSGWGTCRSHYRNIQVLKNVGTEENPDWQPYSVNVPYSCDCQIQAGSALHNFVSGSPSKLR